MKIVRNLGIHFFYNGQRFFFKNRAGVKNYIWSLLKNEGYGVEAINIIFASKREIKKINKSYLKHNYYTDVLTFDFSTSNDRLIADIYVCPDIIKANSRIHNSSFKQELHRVIFHGILHLCGYNDKSVSDKEIMTNKENVYLEKYFV